MFFFILVLVLVFKVCALAIRVGNGPEMGRVDLNRPSSATKYSSTTVTIHHPQRLPPISNPFINRK